MILVAAPVLGRCSSGLSAATVYTNTVFLSSRGNDATAQPNNLARPYLTLAASLAALYGNFAGQATTLAFPANYSIANGDAPDGSQLDALLGAGLTVLGLGNGGGTRVMGTFPFGDTSGSLLTLTNIAMDAIEKTANGNGIGTPSAGTITGNNASIGSLSMVGLSGEVGAPGSSGVDASGGSGGDGMNGAPPSDGSPGFPADASGGTGGDGNSGSSGWSVVLRGTLTVTNLYANGGSGGPGGSGGNGANATGGKGGNGGSAFDDGSGDAFNGGNGGNGGDAVSNGGNGGNGGAGATGGNVFYEATVNVQSYYLSGGGGGSGGSGGSPGNAVAYPDYVGAGGGGVNGGSNGNNGTPGSEIAGFGFVGGQGSDGGDGSFIPI